MVRPRWQGMQTTGSSRFWRRWDQTVALIAAANLAWVLFDVTYVPLRSFWLQRTLYPLPSVSLGIPLPWLPDITPIYDPVKGIEPHRDTSAYMSLFRELEQVAAQQGINSPAARQRRLEMVVRNSQLIDENPFVGSGNAGTLEKLKNRLRARAAMDSPKQAAAHLLGDRYLSTHDWKAERDFWNRQILPLAATNHWRGINESGLPIDHSWRIDVPFQILFLIDILLRTVRLKRRYPGIRWRDALLRRWIDLPLLLPFWRLLRVAPVTERLSKAQLIQLEPLRTVVSRAVVALLALELFEVLTVRILDAMQQLIRSPHLPQRIRGLRSHQSIDDNGERELAELLRLWLPLLLTQVGPGMRPQLVALFGHALQRSVSDGMVPAPLRELAPIQKAETEFSRQLAGGMVDALLGLSRSAGDRLGKRDMELEDLSIDVLDRFWDELARTLEKGPVLDRSQELVSAFLEELKRTSVLQLRTQGGVSELITELDGLNFSAEMPRPTDRA
ncbi:MAG: hypothetical protein VKK03_03715 [Synechococcus sp.]|nr:hypothetical protein [Synechococcus sp.]